MEDHKQTSFTFEIDNLFEKEGVIASPTFLSGGCEWFVQVFLKGDYIEDHLSLYLSVANPESLRLGWKRRATYSFLLMDQSGKGLFRKPDSCKLFCAQAPGWGLPRAVPLEKLQENGFLEKNKLIVKVEVKVVEVVDESEVTGKETLDVEGFQVLYSQFVAVNELFTRHPGIAANFKPKNQLVRTTYMTILLDLIEALNKPPHSLSESELTKARSELIDLTEAGFKLDWLKTKLDEVSLEMKKASTDDVSRVQELEEQVKNLNLELDTEKVKSATYVAKVLLLEQTVSDLRAELIKEKAKSTTSKDVLEGVVHSWEVLDYTDLSNEKVE